MSTRSKKYQANLAKINQAYTKANSEVLDVDSAINLLLDLDSAKFKKGASLEIHFNLNINPTKSDQLIRSSVSLPHGNGKEVKIVAFVSDQNVEAALKAGATQAGGEDLIEEIKKAGSIDFDIAIAETAVMKKLAPIARILGTRGVMPNPKTGTVGDDIPAMISSLKGGKVNYKNDKTGNLHILCGKINADFDAKKLIENVNAVIDSVKKAKPEVVKKKFIITAHLTSTFSPSIRIA